MHITISGRAASGKSAVAIVIRNALRSAGLDTEVVGEDTPDHVIEGSLNERIASAAARQTSPVRITMP